jgi:hypothetical protein
MIQWSKMKGVLAVSGEEDIMGSGKWKKMVDFAVTFAWCWVPFWVLVIVWLPAVGLLFVIPYWSDQS